MSKFKKKKYQTDWYQWILNNAKDIEFVNENVTPYIAPLAHQLSKAARELTKKLITHHNIRNNEVDINSLIKVVKIHYEGLVYCGDADLDNFALVSLELAILMIARTKIKKYFPQS